MRMQAVHSTDALTTWCLLRCRCTTMPAAIVVGMLVWFIQDAMIT